MSDILDKLEFYIEDKRTVHDCFPTRRYIYIFINFEFTLLKYNTVFKYKYSIWFF